jgi:3-oxoacyl-[acyl-carrier-protein] synthase III
MCSHMQECDLVDERHVSPRGLGMVVGRTHTFINRIESFITAIVVYVGMQVQNKRDMNNVCSSAVNLI